MTKAAHPRRGSDRSGLFTRVIAVLTLTFSVVVAPGIAQAAFVAKAPAQMVASTLTLATPAASSISVSCTNAWMAYYIGVGVGAIAERANAVEITFFAPDGSKSQPRILQQGSYGYWADSKGQWKYEVRAVYDVPNSSNLWRSPGALTGTFTCR